MTALMILWNTHCEFMMLILSNYSDNFCSIYSETSRYCFGPIIEKELDVLVNEWNHHYIRKSKYCETIGRIPEILYFLTEQYGWCYIYVSVKINLKVKLRTSDCKCILDYALLQYAENNYGHKSSFVSDEFRVYAEKFKLDENIVTPTTPNEALQLFLQLLQDIEIMKN